MARILRLLPAAAVSLALLAACAGQDGGSTPNPVQAAAAHSSAGAIYVINAGGSAPYLTIYSQQDGRLLRTISLNGGGGTEVSMVVDTDGTLYLADYGARYEQPQLRIYNRQGAKLLRTLHPRMGHGMRWLTVDAYKDVYALCNGDTICDFEGAHLKKTLKYPKVYPPIAVDSASDVAMVGCAKFSSDACVFHRGAKTPFWKIASGIGYVGASTTLFDESGDLFASNVGGNTTQNPGDIVVFSPGATSPSRTITDGISEPVAMAIASDGTLYVYNDCAGTFGYRGLCSAQQGDIEVYPPGAEHPSTEITAGVAFSGSGATIGAGSSLAMDNTQTLYVLNQPAFGSGNGTVTTYAPGATSPTLTISDQIDRPIAIAVGP